MKQLVYRNILGNNPRKHEVSIEEIYNRCRSRVSRKLVMKYYIKERYDASCIEEIKDWIRSNKSRDNRRNCHIMTMVDSITGECKIMCKVLGYFYVVWGLAVYKVLYVNGIKIQVHNEA